MADAKISALTSYTPPITTDVLPIVDVTTSTTKKITIANFSAYQRALSETLTNKTITAAVLSGTFTGTFTLTTPTITKPIMDATNPTAQTYTPGSGATATLDCSLGNQHRITMPAGNITIALSNITNSQIILISITQDSGGSRTVTWFSTIRWAGGAAPTLTTTASKRDVFGFIRTGSGTYDGFVVGQNL